jgi:starch synthase
VWSSLDLLGGGPAEVLFTFLGRDRVPAYVLRCAGHYERGGGPYVDESGRDWPDNAQRFAALGWVARELSLLPDDDHRADVIHTHDWQAGLAAAYVKLGPRPEVPCIATVHSIAYPGAFDQAVLTELGLPEACYSIHGVEFYGRVSFLKAALYYSDAITTVSPTYAKEIQIDGLGGGFEGLLRTRSQRLRGILNGVDYEEWSPDRDPFLPVPYGPKDLRGKARARAELTARMGLAEGEGPVFGLVSRLIWQKGIDYLLDAVPWLVAQGGRLAVLGSGEAHLVSGLDALSRAHPGRVSVHRGYDESLSHLVQAGSDVILVPSRAEPCGLTQLYALRYGSPPVVRRTGGLADTVVDTSESSLALGTATGFTFVDPTADALRGALSRALLLFGQRQAWRRLQLSGMRADFGWERSAESYASLYESLR